jgi:hypothetical protein
MSSEVNYFFEEHIRNFLNEKWTVAIQFPDDKILINQISARIELARFVDTFAILDDNNPNDYESRYSKEIETKILNSIEIKNRKRIFRKIISFGLA